MPPVRGETFAGQAVSLPESLRGGPAILVIGFTEASRASVSAWGTWLAHDQAVAGTAYYEMPVLAGVPRVMRGFVMGRVRAAVAEEARPHFVAITEGEAEWRRLAGDGPQDDAFVLVVDGQGVVRWRAHGVPTRELQATLVGELTGLRSQALAAK